MPPLLDRDEEWLMQGHLTGHSCALEEDNISYGDSVVAVTVGVAKHRSHGIPGGYVYAAVDNEASDILYDPRFLLDVSWVDVVSDMVDLDEKVQAGSDPNAVFTCGICASGIYPEEVFVITSMGEIHRSNRAPNGEHGTSTFVPQKDPSPYCVSCIQLMHRHVLALWDEGVKQNEECEYGTIHRCWRQGCQGNGETCPNRAK